MHDENKTNVTANRAPATAKAGGKGGPPSGTAAGNGAPTLWATYSTMIEGWINDPRAPVVLVGVIIFLFAVAVFSG